MADQDDQKTTKPGKTKFKQIITQFQDSQIDQKTQEEINKPYSDPKTALTEDDKKFLENLIQKINGGGINLLAPSSIINQEIYDQLPSDKKAKADLFIQNTLFSIRRVYDFYNNPFPNDSDMMIQMVQELRQKIDDLEKELGNVLKL